jgi:hypothetical protein
MKLSAPVARMQSGAWFSDLRQSRVVGGTVFIPIYTLSGSTYTFCELDSAMSFQKGFYL